MGKGVKEKISAPRLRKGQGAILGDEWYSVSYKEIKNGVTYIRTRWTKRKPEKKKRKRRK